MSATVLTRYLQTLVDTLSLDYGVSAERLFDRAGLKGLSGERMADRDAEALWVAAQEMAADPCLGIKVGERVRYSSYSTLGHLLVTSETVGDALRASCDLAFYVGGAGKLSLDEDESGARITYEPLYRGWRAAEVRSEAVLLPFVRFARWASPEALPSEVQLTRAAPKEAEDFAVAFSAPVVFGAKQHAIRWSADALAQPMSDANPELNEMLRHHVEAALPNQPGFLSVVRHTIENQLPTGTIPSVADIALKLHMSTRSFQRHLAAAGLSYRTLLLDIRLEAAKRLLNGDKRSVSDIAEQLGYSEPAPFVRAFKKQTGRTPAQWRKDRES